MAAYQCPKCKSVNLTVAVIVNVKLVQYEDNQETEYDGGDHEWDDTSSMTCDDCHHVDSAGAFVVEPDDDSEVIKPVYKVFPEGDVIALWGEPDSRGLVSSYQQVGQHSEADARLYRDLRDATAEEAAPLETELLRIGYTITVRCN